jgi:hypothetical protein
MCPMAHPGLTVAELAMSSVRRAQSSRHGCSAVTGVVVGGVPRGFNQPAPSRSVDITRSIGEHPDGVPLPWSHVAAAMMSRVGCCPLHGGDRLCPRSSAARTA